MANPVTSIGNLTAEKPKVPFNLSKLSPQSKQSTIKKKRPMGVNDEFVEIRTVTNPDGTTKRVRVYKRHEKKSIFLTEEQKEEIDNAFVLFDKDNSGSIDVHELKDALKALGIHNLSKDEVVQMMQKVDKDGSGSIDKEEFVGLMAKLMEQRNQ